MFFSMLPSLSSMMTVDCRAASTHRWAEARLADDYRELAAFRVALQVVRDRCGGAPHYVDPWLGRYQGGPAHDPDLLDCLEAFVGSESMGTRTAPATDVHLGGFVAEHVWHLLTVENVLGFGSPVRIEGPEWSVTDAGGDGLAIYRNSDVLVFRLWESKAHTGTDGIRDVVNGACRQVDSNALNYLARFSKIGQRLEDPELQHFYGRLPEMWKKADREAGGGVSVATGSGATDGCFGGFANYWAFTHDDQRQGLVVIIDDFASFAQAVREQVWKGL